MAMSRTCIGGTNYNIKSGRTYIGGTNYDIKKGRTYIDGTNYDISFGTPLGELAAKTSVYMNVDGVRTEWKVAHQGIPDATIYDASCNGTWLLMKDVYTTMKFGTTNAYADSNVHTYLNNTFLELLDADIKNAVKQVKIPYSSMCGTTLYTGADGLSTKVFLPSIRECVGAGYNDNAEGAKLDYFTSLDDRIAYLIGTATSWLTRSPRVYADSRTAGFYFKSTGNIVQGSVTSALLGVRPLTIFDSETLVDENFNVVA